MPQVLKHVDGNRSSLCPVHDSLYSVSDDSLDACSKDMCLRSDRIAEQSDRCTRAQAHNRSRSSRRQIVSLELTLRSCLLA